MVARAVSTIIGTLFFVMIASMFIVLVVRSLYIYGELAGKLISAVETKGTSSEVSIQVSYSKLEPVAASTVTTVEVLQGYSPSTDPALLDSQDGKCIQVEAESTGAEGEGGEIQLIKNGNFSEGLTHWNYGGNGNWDITYLNGNPAAYYSFSGASDFAYIGQAFTLDFTTTSITLSFRYTSNAKGVGKKGLFNLTVALVKNSNVIWSDSIDLLSVPENSSSYEISKQFNPGEYVLWFNITMAGGKKSTFEFTLDNVSLTAQVPAPTAPPGAAYTALIKISFTQVGLSVNGTLVLRFDDTANLKVFTWTGDRWRLAEEDIVLPGQWFSITLSGDSLLQAYSSRPFLVELDYLAVTVEFLSNATVIVTNEGEEKAEIYAAWLRNSTWEARVARYAVLFPDESLTLQFNTTLTPGCEYETRVVSATRVFSLIFKP